MNGTKSSSLSCCFSFKRGAKIVVGAYLLCLSNLYSCLQIPIAQPQVAIRLASAGKQGKTLPRRSSWRVTANRSQANRSQANRNQANRNQANRNQAKACMFRPQPHRDCSAWFLSVWMYLPLPIYRSRTLRPYTSTFSHNTASQKYTLAPAPRRSPIF